MIRFLTCLWLLLPVAALAEEKLVLGLSQDEVAISATFTGSEILIFGAIRRDAPASEVTNLGILIAVSGPNIPVTVRRKDRVGPIWINTESVPVEIAPSFYAVATSGPITETIRPLENLHHAISPDRVVRAVGQDAFAATDFTEAYVRIKERTDEFQLLEGGVTITDETLFSAAIKLPSNLTEGNYRTRIFLTRDGQVMDYLQTEIPVFKVGIERWLYNLAQEQAAIYGFLSLLIAVVAGWAASAAFAAMRR